MGVIRACTILSGVINNGFVTLTDGQDGLGLLVQVLRHHDVKVVLINPGPVATEMTKGVFDHSKSSTPDIAQVAMLALTLTPQSVPTEINVDVTLPARY